MQRQDTACRIKARSYGSFLPALMLLLHGEGPAVMLLSWFQQMRIFGEELD
jgi:hypothetical protein